MDICPSNIRPCDICPYQQYLSCNWPDFDQNLKVGSWGHLDHIQAVVVTFVQTTFVLTTFVLTTFVHINNISAVNTHHPQKLNVRNISAVTVPEVYQTLRVGPWDHLEHIIAKKNVAKKKFAEKKIWRKKKFRQNFFAHKQFLTRNFFSPKFFFRHFFLPNKIFLPNFFLPNKFFH